MHISNPFITTKIVKYTLVLAILFSVIGCDKIKRVSVTSEEEQANGNSLGSKITSNGRRVLFFSNATNLLPETHDQYNAPVGSVGYQVYVRDRSRGITKLISIDKRNRLMGTGGQVGADISDDGQWVVWISHAKLSDSTVEYPNVPGTLHLYLKNTETNKIWLISRRSISSIGLLGAIHPPNLIAGNKDSFGPIISQDGRHILFSSRATNLVPVDTNGVSDLFHYDHQTRRLVRMTPPNEQPNGHTYASSINSTGERFTFTSEADNWMTGDTNKSPDSFTMFINGSHIKRVGNKGWDNTGEWPNKGSDGSHMNAFYGQVVVLSSNSTNLIEGVDVDDGKSHIFTTLHDRALLALVSINSDGVVSDGNSYSAKTFGGYVVFESDATNLSEKDKNEYRDIYLHNRRTRETKLISGIITAGNGDSSRADMNSTGSKISFDSTATNLIENDTNDKNDVFIWIRGYWPDDALWWWPWPSLNNKGDAIKGIKGTEGLKIKQKSLTPNDH